MIADIADEPVAGYVGFDQRGVFVGRAYESIGLHDRRPNSWEVRSARAGWLVCNLTEEQAIATLKKFGAITVRPERGLK